MEAAYRRVTAWSVYFMLFFTFALVLSGNLVEQQASGLTMLLVAGAMFVLVVGFLRLRASTMGERLRAPFHKEWGAVGGETERQMAAAIVIYAAAGLFLELAVIRWHSSTIPMFAFYKNFSLLACFAGLGFGYATSASRQNHLLYTPWLLILQIFCLLLLRYGAGENASFLMSSPVGEQTNMGVRTLNFAGGLSAGVISAAAVVYCLLVAVFATTVAVFVPIGQITGRVMDRLPKLRAYGLNLLGSVVGVVAFTIISFVWAPPVAWFVPVIAAFAFFAGDDHDIRRAMTLALAALVILLSWPTNPTVQRIYSPYQLLERTMEPSTGLMQILSAGAYYQKVYDFSANNRNHADGPLAAVRNYYDLPYKLADNLGSVAIVGAGSGNDVAAALRAGAQHVDAVEIDPVIVALGEAYHPERPYSDPRVSRIVEDARTFFRTTDQAYDTIVYGVLDSHTQLSQGTSVRIDSFVYTVEGFKESYARLKPGGTFYVSFTLLSPAQGPRIYEMIRRASGQTPLAARVAYDQVGTTAFVVRKGSDPAEWEQKVRSLGFEVVTDRIHADVASVDLPTDDWPFFYMYHRVYPVTYLPSLVLILLLTALWGRQLLGSAPVHAGSLVFFFLGAGFMLIETKAITELGLLFGNTWMVVAIVIIAILTMAFLANLAVDRLGFGSPAPVYPILLAAIALAYFAYGSSIAGSYGIQKLVAVALLTGPMFFSGIIFSTELNRAREDVSSALGFNILGALFGGILEYNSMYFGFAFLFILAGGLYALAMVMSRLRTAAA